WYMHPNGQLPAYEWQYGDVNPPVHAWAAWKVYEIDRDQKRSQSAQSRLAASAASGFGDKQFLERVFHKLLLNFTWWVNRKDAGGRNIFQGGFLGLDNIGVFDRSAALPTGGHINQADGTSWMATYALNLMRIALELAQDNPIYQDLATKFFEHFLHIASAMTRIGAPDSHDATASRGVDLWDPEDEFFYDVLCLPDGTKCSLKVRSMVGLLPLLAVEVLDPELLAKVPEFTQRLEWFLNYRPDLAALVSRWQNPGKGETRLLSLLRGHRMKALLKRMLDETEFLSDYGLRAVSRHHLEHPYTYDANGMRFAVQYNPAESDSGVFGGNSNWRGPVWMPVNFLLIESLRKFHDYYGDDFRVECPTGSGRKLSIREIADELSRRLAKIFLRDKAGRRPVLAYHEKLLADPHFRDLVLFHEYFHGDTGRGVGASHQTGWTALVAELMTPRTTGNTDDHQQQICPRDHAGRPSGHSHAGV
ncbi:MAG: glucosidase, partial [Tepidisphaeraceae bacterium]